MTKIFEDKLARKIHNVVRSCQMIELIKIEYLVGNGIDDPFRTVEDYFDREGNLIFTFDILKK
jgi:hypothetical protein